MEISKVDIEVSCVIEIKELLEQPLKHLELWELCLTLVVPLNL